MSYPNPNLVELNVARIAELDMLKYKYPSPDYKYLRQYWEVDSDGDQDNVRDGLPAVKHLKSDHSWPFKNATFNGWHYNEDLHIWHFDPDDEPNVTGVIGELWRDAEEKAQKGETSASAWLFRKAISQEAATHNDILIQAFCFGQFALLLGGQLTFIMDECEYVRVLKIGATYFKLPSVRFLYGKALVEGTGGLRPNLALCGMRQIDAAAASAGHSLGLS